MSTQVDAAGATSLQQPPPPQRILLVGDSTAETWLVNQLTGMLLGTTPPPAGPSVPECAQASVGLGSLVARGAKCA
jgi:hypothetical protein